MRDGKSVQKSVPRVRWYPASGRVKRFFDVVLVYAYRSYPKPFPTRLSPCVLAELVPYSPEYIAGFRAEGYTVDLDDGFVEARAR